MRTCSCSAAHTTPQSTVTSRCTRRVNCSGTQAGRWGREGVQISDAEARRFARLSEEEKQAIAQVARLARRVSAAAERGQRAIDEADAEFRAATREAQRRMGPI
jgi:hypothetical protein